MVLAPYCTEVLEAKNKEWKMSIFCISLYCMYVFITAFMKGFKQTVNAFAFRNLRSVIICFFTSSPACER